MLDHASSGTHIFLIMIFYKERGVVEIFSNNMSFFFYERGLHAEDARRTSFHKTLFFFQKKTPVGDA